MMRQTLVYALLVSVMVIVIGGIAAHTFKLSYYRINSGSMEPDFPVGTIVIASGAVPMSLHQAITFKADEKIVTHVLVGYNPDGSLITRGIANSTQDDWRTPIYPKDVQGRVILRFLLFAPTFWLSLKGAMVMIGLGQTSLAFYLWRRMNRTRFTRRYA